MALILNESRKIYISNINSVQDYIEENLENALTVNELADTTNFSEFHFQRIYRQMTGESLYSYIKRLRLEKAAFYLNKNKSKTITNIALDVGFSNQASFAKAFKSKYKMSAREFRQLDEIDLDDSRNGKVLDLNICYTEPIEVSIKNIDDLKVVYIRNTGPYKGDHDLFVDLFTKLYKYVSSEKLVKSNSEWYTACHDLCDLTEEEKLRISVCMTVDKKIKTHGEYGSMEIKGGKCLVGRFILSSDDYQGAWDYMLTKYLPESGYMPDDRMFLEHFPKQDNKDDKRIVEIIIPITPL